MEKVKHQGQAAGRDTAAFTKTGGKPVKVTAPAPKPGGKKTKHQGQP